MYYYNTGKTQESRRRKAMAVRSAFMRAEEIDQERENSGWNPYKGEEELPREMNESSAWGMTPGTNERAAWGMTPGMNERETWEMTPERRGSAQGMTPVQRDAMEAPSRMNAKTGQEMVPQNERQEGQSEMPPYFTMPDYAGVMEEQKMMERDLRRLQSMYPDTVKRMLPYIEEECDKMEYEGSAMYDEHPDHTTVQQIVQRILEQMRDELPPEMLETTQNRTKEVDEMLSMQYRGPGRRPGRNWADDLIRVLLLQEMHHRRCRHRSCKRAAHYR